MKSINIIFFSGLLSFCLPCCQSNDTFRNWESYRGDDGANCYSSLDQINKNNVNELEPAWIFHTDDPREGNRSTIECNPIIVDNIMYLTSPELKLFALDAASGKEIWMFDPFKEGG